MKAISSTGSVDIRKHLYVLDRLKKQFECTKRKSEKMMYKLIGKPKGPKL